MHGCRKKTSSSISDSFFALNKKKQNSPTKKTDWRNVYKIACRQLKYLLLQCCSNVSNSQVPTTKKRMVDITSLFYTLRFSRKPSEIEYKQNR